MNITAIYGAEDKAHAIPCRITEAKFLTDGTPVYIAKCEGGTIQATPDMFVYLFTAIIKDEDGNDKSRTGYHKSADAARIEAESHLDKGETFHGVIYA